MAADLVVTPEAQQDVSDAYGWYEQQQPGSGATFLARIRQRIDEIRRQPLAHQLWRGQYRKAVVRKPTYLIVYHYDGATDTVTVHAVFHTSRDPNDLLGRLP